MMSKIKQLDYTTLSNAISCNNSISELLLYLGYLPHSTYYTELRARCQELGLQPPNYDLTRTVKNSAKPISEILVDNSTYNRQQLKIRLIKEKLLEEKCYICGLLPIWQDKPLTLQLDRINGKNNDNRLPNLRLLCPNCHSQTETFCGRSGKRISNRQKANKKVYLCDCGNVKSKMSRHCRKCHHKSSLKYEWPPYEELLLMLQHSNYVQVAKLLGCTDNAIRKHLKRWKKD